MEGVQRIFRWLISIISIVGFTVAFAYFVVNVSVIPERIANIQASEQAAAVQSEESKQEPGSDTVGQADTAGTAKQPAWVSELSVVTAFLAKISIDLSAITPALLVWFFGAILFSNYYYRCRASLPKNVKARLMKRINTLPFPQHYVSVWIYWGFIGTLWGFMLIGWRMHDSKQFQAIQTLDILVKAFGTALLSTFTAVVLVFVIAPPVRHLWLWAHGAKAVQQSDEELKQIVRGMTDEMAKASDVIGELNKAVVLLKQSIDGVIDDGLFGRLRQEITEPIKTAVDNNKTAIVEAQQVWGEANVKATDKSRDANIDATNKSREAIIKATNETRDAVNCVRDEAADQHKTVKKGVEALQKKLNDFSTLLADIKKQWKDSTDGLSRILDSNERIMQALSELGEQVRTLGGPLEKTMKGMGVRLEKLLADIKRTSEEQTRRVIETVKAKTANPGTSIGDVLAGWLKERANRGGRDQGKGTDDDGRT